MDSRYLKKGNSTNLILIIAILIVVIGTGAIIFQRKNSEPTIEPIPTKAPITATYTLTDVSKHATETDCWMAIENKVYDFTNFIPDHPGGKLIISACGKEATKLFRERPTNAEGPHPK